MLPSIKAERSGYEWLHRFFDSVFPLLVLLALTVVYAVEWHDRYSLLGLLGGFLFVTANQMIGTYNGWKGRSLWTSIRMVSKAWFLTWVVMIILAFLFKRSSEFSRVVTFGWALATFFVLIGYRVLIRLYLRYYWRNGCSVRRIAIVGAGKTGKHLARVIKNNCYLGYQIVGYYDDNARLQGRSLEGIEVLGNTDQVCFDAQERRFDELYLCFSLESEKNIIALLNRLADSTVLVKYIPDFFAFDLLHSQWSDLKGIPVISVYDTPMTSGLARFAKRTEDVVLTVLILLCIWPLMVLIALGVKLGSPGPVFFRQERVGWNGQHFTILKFRSMIVHDDRGELRQASSNDDRVTSLGRLLRKTSLDELPQLINVLRGEMSLVGPRPHAVAHHEYYAPLIDKYMQRHLIKPGLTGYAQISGFRGETQELETMSRRIEMDRYYINNWSLWLDLKIIAISALRGWKDKNAY